MGAGWPAQFRCWRTGGGVRPDQAAAACPRHVLADTELPVDTPMTALSDLRAAFAGDSADACRRRCARGTNALSCSSQARYAKALSCRAVR
jgi:hypothetical protein